MSQGGKKRWANAKVTRDFTVIAKALMAQKAAIGGGSQEGYHQASLSMLRPIEEKCHQAKEQ
jgi:hypothetical protein